MALTKGDLAKTKFIKTPGASVLFISIYMSGDIYPLFNAFFF